MLRQSARQDKGLARQLGSALLLYATKLQTGISQALYQLAISWLLEKFNNGLRDARSDFIHFLQLFSAGLHEGLHGAEMLGQELGGALAHKADTETQNHTLQRQLLGSFNFIEYVFPRLFAHTLHSPQLAFADLINVGNVFHQSAISKLVDRVIT